MSVRAPVGKLNRADRDYGIGRGLCAVRAIGGVSEPRFLGYALEAAVPELQSHATGSTYDAVAIEDVANMVIGVPLPAKQGAIADFLDRETAKIDALIAKQEELIERIAEKRRSFTAHAVTRGLNGASILRESGVDWIGPVPTHWLVKRMKRVAKLESGHTPSKTVPEYWVNCDIPWVSLNDTKQLSKVDYISDTAEKVSELGIANSSAHILPKRAVVFTRDATVGLAAITTRPMAVSQHLIAWICGAEILPEYLLRVIYAMKAELDRLTAGATIKTIGMPLIGQLTTPVPPMVEQRSIVAAVEELSQESDAAVAACEEMLKRLRERRSALITAAVTGQIEVGAASAHIEPVVANDNRRAIRAVVGAEIVSRQGSAKNFGRVKLQKLIYLAEVHAGIHELAGDYVRQAAGPLAPDLLSETERGMEARGFYRTVPPKNEGDGYIYSRIGKVGAHGDQFAAMLGDRAATLTQLIDRFKDYDTRQVEAITTLYAVWNDALIDGETPTDDRIIRGVLEEWHPEKKDKFAATDLKSWLSWMRRNGVVPAGTGSRTQLDRLFV